MKEQTEEDIKLLEAYREKASNSFLTFLKGLTIPSATGPQVFDDCLYPFQLEFFQDVAPALEAVRLGHMPPKRRFWVERTKKASKDGDIAVCLLWLVAFAVRPTRFQAGAADREQAAIIRDRITDILHWNPWLNELVTVHTWNVKSENDLATLRILAADIAGSHGATPDLLVLDELSHITKWEFIENLMDNATGVPQGVVIVATNAGFKGTKADVLRKNAIESEDWYTHFWQRPSPWLNKTDLADAKRRNPATRYNRLYWGKWASGKGDALDEEDIDRCFSYGIRSLVRPEEGWQYIAGLDLGIKNDHSGLVILGVNEREGVIRTAWYRDWAPNPKTGEVDLVDVQDTCEAMSKAFGIWWFGFDPHQATLMAQQLRRKRIPMQEMVFNGKNLDDMAQSFLQVVENGVLQCYDDGEGTLRRDFGKFNIVERANGFKLESVSDEYGHADVGTALVICLPKAVSMLEGKIGGLLPGDVLVEENDSPLTEKEVDDMPEELRDIYNSVEEPIGTGVDDWQTF
ncbi:hypothetical protein LCGC14_0248920 [marine sediment metagenome]|uniref:Terminase large subunit gp17-like C-terminal domain-containing protein n=1 Tax=marine sediment metagenome TaxID=412755 RepID=A0A0F9U538_9ZZZZ